MIANNAEASRNVRHLEGAGWQVLIERPYAWHSCSLEQEARFIASGLDIAAAVTSGAASGAAVAEELEAAAAVALRTIGYGPVRTLIDAAALARSGLSARGGR